MLETLITSKTRIKLLLKFFLNSNSESYLRNLETEFGESTNGIRLELNKFEQAGLLQSEVKGNRKYFKANLLHPLYSDIHNLLLKHIGFDRIVTEVVSKMGDLHSVYLVGDFAKGKDAEIIDLVFVGDQINKNYLHKLIGKAEDIVHRKIRSLIFTCNEISSFLSERPQSEYLLLWEQGD